MRFNLKRLLPSKSPRSIILFSPASTFSAHFNFGVNHSFKFSMRKKEVISDWKDKARNKSVIFKGDSSRKKNENVLVTQYVGQSNTYNCDFQLRQNTFISFIFLKLSV